MTCGCRISADYSLDWRRTICCFCWALWYVVNACYNQGFSVHQALGCGKTSIISLLERFYDYEKGNVLINGVELRSLELNSYRGAVSLVSQEPTMYQGAS